MTTDNLTRQEIADALGVVDGLTPTPDPPSALLPGCAWPVWVRSEYATACLFETRWAVFVVLPAEPSTIDVTDELVDAIGQALMKIAGVESLEPVSLQTETGGATVPAIRATIVD